jgi:hypothetical protein
VHLHGLHLYFSKAQGLICKLYFPRVFRIILQWENVVSRVHRLLDMGMSVVHRGLVATTVVLLTGEGMGKRMHENNGSGGSMCVLSPSLTPQTGKIKPKELQ